MLQSIQWRVSVSGGIPNLPEVRRETMGGRAYDAFLQSARQSADGAATVSVHHECGRTDELTLSPGG